jgi:pre-rRNA-processing protein RIX1
MTLTKIYCMTHGYQTLLREITTPTLPTFITSCLNLTSAKPSSKSLMTVSSLEEIIFQSFATLVPHHPTTYRPFVSQIRSVTRPYLAPTLSDCTFVSSALKSSARQLTVVLHQTAPKNAGGEEWAKAVHELIKYIHNTADLVFRAVIEDWESTAGYVAEPVDVNRELQASEEKSPGLPPWSGIHSGIERLSGLLEYLADYFAIETSTPVTMPLGAIFDMVARMLSISIPASDAPVGTGSVRLHPAIDRDERDALWTGLPQIYVAAVKLVGTVSERLQENFVSLAQGSFDQLIWVFPYGKHSSEFRKVTYQVLAKVLSLIGPSFGKSHGAKLSTIIKASCHDLSCQDPDSNEPKAKGSGVKVSQGSGLHNNADTFLRDIAPSPIERNLEDPDLVAAARTLLPLFMSHIPQRHLDISMRSLIERTAILGQNKSAMLASILNPYIGKNGRALATILPHLTRAFPDDDVVEILLRPRMPLLPSGSTSLPRDDENDEPVEDEDMDLNDELSSSSRQNIEPTTTQDGNLIVSHHGLGPPQESAGNAFETSSHVPTVTSSYLENAARSLPQQQQQDVKMDQSDVDSSDDESVHLTMQLDSDSGDEST